MNSRGRARNADYHTDNDLGTLAGANGVDCVVADGQHVAPQVRHDKARAPGVNKVAVDTVAQCNRGNKTWNVVSAEQVDGGVLLPDSIAVTHALDVAQ